MSVTALFRCESIIDTSPTEEDRSVHVKLRAAISDENKSFSKWTPSGDLNISITNPNAIEQFTEGEFYRITFDHAPDAVGS